jgi:NAD(P)-dependent dehydrogenase (short-subunit alcohol dehydrogenase family)
MMVSSMVDKVCLVTGANSGIGKATALGLARLGATVVMLCRDSERGEAALHEIEQKTGRSNLQLMICDLSSQKSIRDFASGFREQHDRLDVLVNNAGVLMPQRSITEDGLETTFAINHLGYFLLTNLLLDLLKKSAPSRVVNVSSAAHAYGHLHLSDLQHEQKYGAFRAYASSKLANALFTRELARRLEGTGVTVNCLHPGGVATSLFRRLPKFLESAIRLVTISPERGARTSVFLASAPDVAGITGKYFVRCKEASCSREAQDDDLAQSLWAVSEELCGQTAELQMGRGQAE